MSFEELSTEAKDRLTRTIEPAFDVAPGLGAFFRADFLRRKGWAAAIFEGDFRDDQAQISSGLLKKRISTVACGGLAEYMKDWYSISLKESDFKEVRTRYHEPSFFITDNLETFCIISDSDYFWSIAASESDLETTFSVDIEHSLTEFESDIAPLVASSDDHNRKIGSMLKTYLDTCLAIRHGEGTSNRVSGQAGKSGRSRDPSRKGRQFEKE